MRPVQVVFKNGRRRIQGKIEEWRGGSSGAGFIHGSTGQYASHHASGLHAGGRFTTAGEKVSA